MPPKTSQTVFGVSSKNKCNKLKEKYYVSKYQNCRSHPQRIPRWNADSACQNTPNLDEACDALNLYDIDYDLDDGDRIMVDDSFYDDVLDAFEEYDIEYEEV